MASADNTLRPKGSASPGTAGGTSGRDATADLPDDEDDLEDDAESPTEAEGEPYIEETDWERVGIFGAGLALGALIGAGAALLLAPQSGAETREAIVSRVRRVRDRAGDGWDDLGEELRRVARRGRKRMRRGVTRTRWKAADALDRD